jgi:hypothetical protein
MFADDSIMELVPWAIGFVLAVAGLWWIRKITKDIEDN